MSLTAEKKFQADAEAFLARDDVDRFVRELRRDATDGIERPGRKPLENELAAAASHAKRNLIPRLCALHKPARIPSTDFMHRNLAQLWLRAYLEEVSQPKTRPASLRRKYARILLSEANEPRIHSREVIVLPGFQCDEEFRFCAQVNGTAFQCRVRRNAWIMEPWRNAYNAPRLTFSRELFPDTNLMTKWVILVDGSKKRTPESYIELYHPLVDHVSSRIILALRLFKNGVLRVPATYFRQQSLFAGLSKSISAYEMGPGRGEYALSKQERKAFVRLAKWILGLPTIDDFPPSLKIALDYFQSSYAKLPPSEFLDLAIALEALCKIGQEMTYRLPLRLSAILSKTKVDAERLYTLSRELWGTRNDLAHGNPRQYQPKFRAKLKRQAADLRNLVRLVILAHLRRLEELKFQNVEYEREFGKEFEKRYLVGRGLPKR